MSENREQIFREALHALFSRWTALRLAIDNNWGGGDPLIKYNKLCDTIVTTVARRQETYADDIEIVLEGSLVEDFAVEAEDESCREVAIRILELYTQVCAGDYSYAIELVNVARVAPSAVSQSVAAAADSDGEGEDGGMDVDDGVDDVDDGDHQQQPMVDNDGWMTVPAGRGRHTYLPPAP